MENKSSFIACFGDSITAGNPGVSYTRYLQTKRFKNFGIGGDTLSGLSCRIKETLRKRIYKAYIIEIGVNDILLPILSNYSKDWHNAVKRIIARGRVPITNVDEFGSEYEKLLSMLLGNRIIVVNLPCLGENIKGNLNLKVDEYNQCIKRIVNKFKIDYIDFNNWQKEIICKASAYSRYFIHEDYYKMMMDSLMTTFGLSEMLSIKRGLILTVDGVHLNHTGATGLACLLNEKIRGIVPG